MTVQQLMELLESCDPSAEIVLARDAEGNSFALADEDLSYGYFNSRLEEFFEEQEFDATSTADDVEEDEEPVTGTPAVCIWPSY
jgi:hypothetical protein